MELTHVKGVGPSAKRKLEAAGIETVEDLASVDLRTKEVEGLSPQNVSQLRGNAQRLLEARQDGTDLTLVDGLGPSAEAKLNAAGVTTLEDLAELDLRQTDVEGLSTDHIQTLKHNVGYLLPGAG